MLRRALWRQRSSACKDRFAFAPYRLARFILVVLALIGVVAHGLLVLGLLDVEFVTDHFHIH
jgi:hypothetical protein